ncbi:hypothetical protein B9Z51_13230 [Limnohabitans sp. T6-5]|uniref:hypothetical protein n=1 Tax=Limnohabitans sp. T6-5 TaxID=1100724 RepID=UPI000D390283|nr:hypothetical protein [Limnohabitans sp. T6-5]PUE06884.1 hypothetical protein B9Z51_13230 [Limnohabitans sp. T6-5]
METQMATLELALTQMRLIDNAWWRVNDALCLLRGLEADGVPFMEMALADLKALEKSVWILKDAIKRQMESCRERMDAQAVDAMTQSPEDEASLRARLVQADLNLHVLYKHSLQLGRQTAQSLVNEAMGRESGFPPLADNAVVRVELEYLPDQNELTHTDQGGTVLAHQEALFCWVSDKGISDNAIEEDLENENWMDFSHPWMSWQSWLTHDVLEHNYGRNPRFGVAALLKTGTVRVQLRTVRLYEYDLHAGQFVSPSSP